MDEFTTQMRTFAVDRLPNLIIPIAILIAGWVVALVLASLARRALQRTNLDERIVERVFGGEKANKINTSRWVGRVVYVIVLLLVVLAFLQATKLTAASEPINSMLASVLEYIPLIFAAAVILFVGWLVATLAKTLIGRALDRWQLDRRIHRATSDPESEPMPSGWTADGSQDRQAAPISRVIAETSYWLVLLLFLPAVLDALRLKGLLTPVQRMLDEALAFLPNMASALVIAGAGWLVARVVQRLVTSSLAGVGVDRLAERTGMSRVLGRLEMSALIGFVAYVLVLVPVAIGALSALQLESITRPASGMLETFFDAIPAIFGAALVLAIAYAAGAFLASLVARLLNGVGFDNVLGKIGFARQDVAGRPPSELVGGMVMLTVIYFAALEGARILGFATVSALGSELAVFAGHVLLGLVILGVGMYLARLASEAVRGSDIVQARSVAIVTRIAVLGLAGGMALRQMGIADEIIELAFGLLLGALAVAFAIAFGLGGRDAASRALEDMRARMVDEPAGAASGDRAAS